MRSVKILGIVAGALVGALVLLLLGVWLLVNPNDYKGRIEKLVKDATGRELTLGGDIKLAVFPWLALQTGPASLGNPPGFAAEPFAALRHMSLRVKLLPLLRKELQIGKAEIDGLDLRLRKDAHGRGNWEGFGGTRTAAPGAGSSGPGTLPQLAGLSLRDSRLSYQDFVVDHVNLEVGKLAGSDPVPIKLAVSLLSSKTAQPMSVTGQLGIQLDAADKRYRIDGLDLEGTRAAPAGGPALTWKFSAPAVTLDLAAQTLSAGKFTAQLAGAQLDGSLEGSRVIDAPRFTGAFTLAPLVPRELMSRLGMAAPKTRDPQALSRLSGHGQFSYGDNAAHVSALEVQLDDSTLRGAAAVTDLETHAMTFELALDHIDIDRYLSPAKAAAASQPGTPAAPAGESSSPLRTLQLTGAATIGSAKVAKLSVSQVRVGVGAKGGVIHIQPAQATLYGGSCSADITLDERSNPAALRVETTMSNVDMAQLLRDFAQTQRLAGHGNVTTSLTARGDSGDAIVKSLSGHVAANLADGAVEGIDLWFEINRAMTLVQNQSLPSGASSGRTRFDTFKASADLSNGVATTRDLSIVSQNLRVSGQGTTNLVTEAINYRVDATLLKGVPGGKAANAATLAQVPVLISGTMSSPKVQPDLAGIAKARVQQELDSHKQQIQQTLQDQLKNLLH